MTDQRGPGDTGREETAMPEYRCLRFADGYWRGVVYTIDAATGAETVVYQTPEAARRETAVDDLYRWLHDNRGVAYNPQTGDSK